MYKPFPVMGGKNGIVLTTSSMGRPCLSYVALSIFLSRRQVAKRQPSQHLASRSLDRLGRDVWCWETRRCPGHIFSRPHYDRTGILVNKGIIPKWPYFRLVNYYNLPRYMYIYIYTKILYFDTSLLWTCLMDQQEYSRPIHICHSFKSGLSANHMSGFLG